MQERRALLTALTRSSARRGALVAVVALVVAGADQLTKTLAIHYLAPGGRLDCAEVDTLPRHVVWTLWWELTCNSGAAFGLGRGVTPVVETVAVVLVVALLLAGRRAALGPSRTVAVGVGLLLGGALGNLVDRVARGNGGAVVDFVDALRIGAHDRWPVFNLADSAIVVGAAVLVVGYSRERPGG